MLLGLDGSLGPTILPFHLIIMTFLKKTSLPTLLVLLFLPILTWSQDNPNIHSHNDYIRTAPFWEAYANGLESIETDVILLNGELYVAHETETIAPERTLKSLYLDPIQVAYELKINNRKPFQLLIDIKTEAYSTLEKIQEAVAPYSQLYTSSAGEPPLVTFVISGNRPKASDYTNYPDHILFDYQSITEIDDLPMEKIALISLSFGRFSDWNGKGRLIDSHQERLEEAIGIAHSLGKPFRFWATPDSKTSWKALSELGVDYINTDMPYAAKSYLSTLPKRLYSSPNQKEIYTPTFEVDGKELPIKSVILLIGDGFGLAQFSSALYGNGNQLSLATLKNLGLIKTQAADDFTTDSAAAGTALSTGQKVKNRSVGALPDGSPAQNLPEYLQQYGFTTGIITTDNVTGATPGAFYAHQTERDLIREIAGDLAKSPINLFIGGGKNDFLRYDVDEIGNLEDVGFELLSGLDALAQSKADRVGYFAANHGLPRVAQGRQDYLKNATNAALQFMNAKNAPFFLMIEAAYIDSGGHSNHVETVVEEGMDFDEAVGAALKFADEDGQTLVIITADHETGGATLPQGNIGKGIVEMEFSTHDHTGVPVPIFAYGPHAGEFRGVYENTEVFHKIVRLIEKYQK